MFLTTWVILATLFTIFVLMMWFKLKESDLYGFIIVIFIAVAIAGFWILPNVSDFYIKIEKIYPTEIIKSKTTVYVEFEGYDTKTYKDKKIYDSIDSAKYFYLYSYYDMDKDINDSYIKKELKDIKDTIYLEKGIIKLD